MKSKQRKSRGNDVSVRRAVLYVRVSSEEQQKDGYSLDNQEKLGRDYAHKKGLIIDRIWKV